MTPLFKELNLADSETLLVLKPPESFESELIEFFGVSVVRRATSKPTSFAIGFVITPAELETISKKLSKSTTGDAIVWVAYPQKDIKTIHMRIQSRQRRLDGARKRWLRAGATGGD